MAKRRRDTTVNVFMGGDSSLEGDLYFSGEARLDGRFKGKIQGEGRLWIGPSANIEADIFAGEVVISGEVRGNVTATRRIEIIVPGKLAGNINAPLVVMDEGVNFEGHCSMANDEKGEPSAKVTLLAASS